MNFRSLFSLVLALGAPMGASAQAGHREAFYADFMGSYTADAPEQAMLCACSATAFLQRCETLGARDAGSLSACVSRNQEAWVGSIVAACGAPGALGIGPVSRPPVTRPVARSPGPTLTRAETWRLAYDGCLRGESPEATYSCACIATYLNAVCVPNDAVPATHVEACMRSLGADAEAAGEVCTSYGALVSSAGAVPPVAPTDPTVWSGVPDADGDGTEDTAQAMRLCTDGLGVDHPQLANCASVAVHVLRNHVEGLAALVPATGRVRYLGQSVTRARLVELLRGQGGIRGFLGLSPGPGAVESLGVAFRRSRLVFSVQADDGYSVAEIEVAVGRNGALTLTQLAVRPTRPGDGDD